MTGQEALEQALQLLHYTDNEGQPDNQRRPDMDRMGLSAVNQAYADLWSVENQGTFVPLTLLAEGVTLSSKGLEALPLGVAMWVAVAEGDDAAQGVMAEVYAQKRGQCPTPLRQRRDVLPQGEWV